MARRVDQEGKTVWVIDEPARSSTHGQHRSLHGSLSGRRHPAVAFSLSLLVWGGGQFYNRQWQWGLLYLLCMVNFYLFPAVLLIHWRPITDILLTVEVRPAHLLGPVIIFVMMGLLVWMVNAIHAYWSAAETDEEFQGVGHPLLPALCSMLIPGWGQFLNGQIKKGAGFLCGAMAGVFAAAVLASMPSLWPTLTAPEDRLFAERLLLMAVLILPPVLLVWGVSVYDAVKVCVDPLKKEPIRKRIEYAVNRVRLAGWHGLRPRIELTLMMCLYLLLSLVLSYHYFPRDYYAAQLRTVRVELAQHQMHLIPQRLDGLIQKVSPPPDSSNPAVLLL
ncbi:MAG: hypothetical protein AB1515_00575 [Nitrospirota bacterium]